MDLHLLHLQLQLKIYNVSKNFTKQLGFSLEDLLMAIF